MSKLSQMGPTGQVSKIQKQWNQMQILRYRLSHAKLCPPPLPLSIIPGARITIRAVNRSKLRFTEISGTFFAGMQACKYSRICKFSAEAGSHTCRNWGVTTSKSNPLNAENRVSVERGKIFGWPTIWKKLHFFRRWAWYTKATVAEFLSLCCLRSSFLFLFRL